MRAPTDRALIDNLIDAAPPRPRPQAPQASTPRCRCVTTLGALLRRDIERAGIADLVEPLADRGDHGRILRGWRAACRDRHRATAPEVTLAVNRTFDGVGR